MKAGVRNNLVGKVTQIKKGTVMCQVKVAVPAKAVMQSVMTLDSLQELKLKKGDRVRLLVKAVSVLLVKD
jgi:molybdate transport system regulatory protein